MMTQAILPNFLRPKSSSFLVRLGRKYDGGYLVDTRDVEKSDCLIGLGINDDWSFERDFCKRNNVNLLAFDASINSRFFLKTIFVYMRQLKLKMFLVSLKKYLGYHYFFRRNKVHYQYFVGGETSANYISIKDIFELLKGHALSKPFLKIDIEGAEYDILPELVKQASLTVGLVIEFHDCDAQIDLIRDFVKKYPHSLVHVHTNNYSPLNENGLPLTIELTFSSHRPDLDTLLLPHPYDMSNDFEKDDVPIIFKDN